MEEVSNFCPAMAVPITVKMPAPITAPMPSAVSASGPSVFFRRVSGFSESEISLSMDFLANSWLYRSGLLNFLGRHPERGSLIAEPRIWAARSAQVRRRAASGPYRLDVPRASFFTLRFIEPRAAVRLALGAAFLRDARRDFLRSSLV